jgi:hypothetical protein
MIVLSKLHFKREEDLIIFDPFTSRKLAPITCVLFNEDFFSEKDGGDDFKFK